VNLYIRCLYLVDTTERGVGVKGGQGEDRITLGITLLL